LPWPWRPSCESWTSSAMCTRIHFAGTGSRHDRAIYEKNEACGSCITRKTPAAQMRAPLPSNPRLARGSAGMGAGPRGKRCSPGRQATGRLQSTEPLPRMLIGSARVGAEASAGTLVRALNDGWHLAPDETVHSTGCAKLARTALSDRGILGRARAHQDRGNRVAKSGVPALAGRASAGAAWRCGELGTP